MRDDNYREGSRREFLELAAQVDTPAFIRRGLRVEVALNSLIGSCEKQREDLLEFCRLRLATLNALIGNDWTRIVPYVDEESAGDLRRLHDTWQPELRVSVPASNAPGKLKSAQKRFLTPFLL